MVLPILHLGWEVMEFRIAFGTEMEKTVFFFKLTKKLIIEYIIGEAGCECSFSGTCRTLGKPNACNCDAHILNLTDTGILSSDKLPIYALRYGGSLTPYSSINYNIGSLICSGKKGIYPSEADNIEKQRIKTRLGYLEKKIPRFELKGPFRPSKNNMIGEINSYFNNYEFSFEVKHQSIPSGYTQLLNVHSVARASDTDSFVYLYPKLDEDKLLIKLWSGGARKYYYPKIKIDRSQYTEWHKD